MKRKKTQTEVNIYEIFDVNAKTTSKTAIWAVVGAVLVGLLLIAGITYPLLIRPYLQGKNPQQPDNTNIGGVVVEERPALTDTINEYLFRRRYVNEPMIYNDEILITEGEDGTGNPRMKNAILFDRTNQVAAQTLANIKVENLNLIHPQINERWIALVDAKEAGGGQICVYNKESKKYYKIKEYAGAAPRITLSGDRLVWFEQLYADLSSVNVYDLATDELLSVEMQENLPFVYGGADIDGDTVVWAGLDSHDKSHEDVVASNRSAIHSYNLATGERKSYQPNMYVYQPRVHGNVMAWIDTDGKITSTLYVSIDGSPPKKISGDVSGFDVGDGYVSYCSNEKMFAYFVDGNLSVPISRQGQRCLYIGDENGYTLWYDITQDAYQRDVVKYIKLERNAWQK